MMSPFRRWPHLAFYLILGIVGAIVWVGLRAMDAPVVEAATWQKLANPGELSEAHAFLENDCSACHTSVKGVEATNCIVCHANNESVLKRQPTAFHANVGSCKECHLEHRGRSQRPTEMDHSVLARLGLSHLQSDEDPESENRIVADRLLRYLRGSEESDHQWTGHPQLSKEERMLDCATCHQNDDRHFQLFGNDCAQCHSATRWNLPEFRHPLSTSLDCAQCHQAPPSHYMMHFKMISATVARDPHAKVDQCYRCHQTTSWNDIKKVGWYKHH